MRNIQIDTLDLSSTRDKDSVSWDCTVCGRARLCPYAAPCLSDVREACRSCGDLLARLGTSPKAAGRGLEMMA